MTRGGESVWWCGPDNRNGVGLALTPLKGLSINLFAPVLVVDYLTLLIPPKKPENILWARFNTALAEQSTYQLRIGAVKAL
jgi:hypothetical protein